MWIPMLELIKSRHKNVMPLFSLQPRDAADDNILVAPTDRPRATPAAFWNALTRTPFGMV
jgi:hypothetical protein